MSSLYRKDPEETGQSFREHVAGVSKAPKILVSQGSPNPETVATIHVHPSSGPILQASWQNCLTM